MCGTDDRHATFLAVSRLYLLTLTFDLVTCKAEPSSLLREINYLNMSGVRVVVRKVLSGAFEAIVILTFDLVLRQFYTWYCL